MKRSSMEYLPPDLVRSVELANLSVEGVRRQGGLLLVQFSNGDIGAAKVAPRATPGLYTSEAAALQWLAETKTIAVAEVIAVAEDGIITRFIPTVAASADTAWRLGLSMARMHQSSAANFGASWPGFIGPLPMSNALAKDWPEFYATNRVLPFLRRAQELGSVDRSGAQLIERVLENLPALAGPAQSPRRIHGDLWSGNVIWGADGQAWLIDASAHGGHPETDIAMLALFGLAHQNQVLDAYQEVAPLPNGWQDRQGIHQLHPLLVHAVLFGSSYGEGAVRAATQYL